MFYRVLASFDPITAFVFVVVGVQHDDGEPLGLRALDVRKLSAGVDVVVDDETSVEMFNWKTLVQFTH